jgi:hypothetical protein
MKNLSLKKAAFPVLAAIAFVLALTSTSCKKDTDCTAVITVLDTAGVPVSGASIRLFSSLATTNSQLQEQILVADSKGEATFVFKHQAILDITATHSLLFPGDTAKGLVKLEPGETVRETVEFP